MTAYGNLFFAAAVMEGTNGRLGFIQNLRFSPPSLKFTSTAFLVALNEECCNPGNNESFDSASTVSSCLAIHRKLTPLLPRDIVKDLVIFRLFSVFELQKLKSLYISAYREVYENKAYEKYLE